MNTYEKILLTSLGLISVSAKEVQKVLKTIVGKKPSKKELEKFLNTIIKEGRLKRKESGKMAKDLIKGVLKELDIPTRSELNALEKKLRDARSQR